MADKLTQQITEALTRVAAEPGGLPLYSTKTDAGLFPNTAAAKPAAQKCLADDLLRVISTGTKSKPPRDLYGLSEKGWEFLLAAVNPKQVLEDFVRVLEARQGEVGELLDTARRMADSLQGLKDAVTRVLPGVSGARLEKPNPPSFPSGKGEFGGEQTASVNEQVEVVPAPLPSRFAGSDATPSLQRGGWGVGVLDASPALDLAPAIVAHLTDRSSAADCPLPELFRTLAQTRALTIGEFHDCLRQMNTDGTITLPAWTGPLYTIPEPQFALLSGHSIAYFASLRG